MPMCEERTVGFIASFVDLKNPNDNISFTFATVRPFFFSLFDHEGPLGPGPT